MEDQQFCPQCKSDSYLNPNIKIFVSPCYHKMCENCLSRIFSQGESGCPECGTILRKVNFTSQTFEDMTVERECRIRKLLNVAFNKKEVDFDKENDFEDYIEKYEDIVFELLESKNDMEVSKRIEALKQDPSIYLTESQKKKIRATSIQKDEETVQETKIVDPMEGIEPPSVILKKVPILPSCYQFECSDGGYSKRITAYRAVYALMDENI